MFGQGGSMVVLRISRKKMSMEIGSGGKTMNILAARTSLLSVNHLLTTVTESYESRTLSAHSIGPASASTTNCPFHFCSSDHCFNR